MDGSSQGAEVSKSENATVSNNVLIKEISPANKEITDESLLIPESNEKAEMELEVKVGVALDAVKADLLEANADILVSPEQEVATREYIRDDDGKVVDIVLSQNGKSASLRELLPGSYTFNVRVSTTDQAPSSPATYNTLDDSISIDEIVLRQERQYTDSELNMAIVHEVGHGNDYSENREEYERLFKEFYYGEAESDMAFSKLNTSDTNDVPTFKEIEQRWTEDPVFTDAARAQFVSIAEKVANAPDRETLNQIYSNGVIKMGDSYIERMVRSERSAWARALSINRQLKKIGVNLYAGSVKDVLSHSDLCLISYQAGLIQDTQNTKNFVKSKYLKYLARKTYRERQQVTE